MNASEVVFGKVEAKQEMKAGVKGQAYSYISRKYGRTEKRAVN